jgi:hypothetical protein
MKRIEPEEQQPVTVVSRADFDRDYTIGYVALEFNPERQVIIQDRRTTKEIRQVLLADITYRCVDCQFDSLDKKVIEEHRAEGQHPWGYGPFKNPYGHIADVEIEGIEDYATFLKEKLANGYRST